MLRSSLDIRLSDFRQNPVAMVATPEIPLASPGDFRHRDPRYQGENFDINMRAATVVHDMAKQKGTTAGRIALAWLLHKGEDIVPIPGTKQRRHLEDNLGAAGVTLTADEMAELEGALSPENISGPRYSPERMAQVDR